MARPFLRDAPHVSLARVLHARLYVAGEGRTFAVRGRVAHDKLKQALTRLDRSPKVANAPAPRDLGVPGCDGELSGHLLHCIGRALNRWRKDLSAEMRRRPSKRRSTLSLARDYREIERLASRLADLRMWQAELAAGRVPAGAPYFLDSAADAALTAALTDERREHPLPPLIAWQARVVYWLSGDCAMRRFLSAAAVLLNAEPDACLEKEVRGFQEALALWKRRSRDEPIPNLRKEFALHFGELSPEVVRGGRFSTRLRGRTFQQHCDRLITNCSELLSEAQRQRRQFLPAALAALVAADGSAITLPQRCFRAIVEKNGFPRLFQILQDLADQIGQPGYDALLNAVEQIGDLNDNIGLTELREFLARGNTSADSAWACEQGLGASSNLSVRAARSLSESFSQRGCALSGYELSTLVNRMRRKDDLAPIHAWLAWLGSVSPRAVTPRLRKVLDRAFWDRYLPSVQQQGWFEQIQPWISVPRRSKTAEDAQPLLERIAAHQQLAGRKETLPKSLRKLLDTRDHRQRELAALHAREAEGVLDQSARARLRHLEQDCSAPPAAKIRRAAEEAFLLLGIETMNAVTCKLAEDVCRKHLQGLVARISPDQYWDFSLWIAGMGNAERNCLGELIASHELHGQSYKRQLADNQAWIGKALVRGMNLDRWLTAKPEAATIGDRNMEIMLAANPRDVFLMGNYFRTCLSLGDCNEISVLANAYDANKQVVFAVADDGCGCRQVFARQLLAVSSDFKLLGYRCYVNSHYGKPHREQIETAMASYCGRLAARCCLELTDQGCPQEIGDHFWYNDGECEWPGAARAAWAKSRSATEAA